MWRYLSRRLLTSLSILIGVSVLTFLMLQFVPGDPVRALIGRQSVTPERLEQIREEMGLNDPLPVQYLNYMKDILSGDFGRSLKNNRPVLEAIMEQFPSTLKLTFFSLLISTFLGTLLGGISAATYNSWLDRFLSFFTIAGISVPPFFLGLLLILFFSVRNKLLPAVASTNDWRGMILPALTLGLGEACWLARMVRSSILDEMNKNYQNLARAKGVSEWSILWKHVMPNAFIPIITAISIQFVYLMAGSVVVESIFARQGIGRLAVTAIQNRDFPLVQGTVTVIAVVYVLSNTLTDIFYAIADPRIRLE